MRKFQVTLGTIDSLSADKGVWRAHVTDIFLLHMNYKGKIHIVNLLYFLSRFRVGTLLIKIPASALAGALDIPEFHMVLSYLRGCDCHVLLLLAGYQT